MCFSTEPVPVSTGIQLLVESGIQQIFAVKSGILGFWVQNAAQGIQNPLTIGIQDPSPTEKKSGIHGM